FSSRRRHTRFSRDWSSNVCSSDLPQRSIQCGHARWKISGIAERRIGSLRAFTYQYMAGASFNGAALDGINRYVIVGECCEIIVRSEERRVGKECRYRETRMREEEI